MPPCSRKPVESRYAQLTADVQQRVLDFVHGLAAEHQETPAEIWCRFAGLFSPAELDEMERIIEEGCAACERRPIPDNDLWIAALAIQHQLTLLTRDTHFEHGASLASERW